MFQESDSDGYIARGICLSSQTAEKVRTGKVARREGCEREEGRGEGIDVEWIKRMRYERALWRVTTKYKSAEWVYAPQKEARHA